VIQDNSTTQHSRKRIWTKNEYISGQTSA